MFNCVINPTYSDVEFTRIFNESWDKMSAQFSITQEQAAAKHVKRVKRMNKRVAVYENDLMIAFFAGAIINNVFKMDFAIFGQNSSGSKSYLHDDEFLSCISTTFNGVFDSVIFNSVQGSTIDSYRDNVQPKTITLIGDLTKDETIEEDGMIYHVTKHEF